MSDRQGEEPAVLSVRDLAVEMGMNRDIIVEHVVVLKALGLVIFTDEDRERIALTPKGRTTRL